MPAPLICLEFNELTPHLMEEFIAAGKLPNFRKLRDQSQTFTSDAQASGEWLNPWVQWVSVHSGLTPEEHGVFRLSNAHKLEQPAIWDLLSDAGHSVWVCGSMNAWYHAPLNGRLLPDPWCQHTPAYPTREFDDYLGFIQKNVQEYANTQSPTTKRDALRFVSFMVRNGLSLGTGLRILKQLARERRGNHRWRRASTLDELQYDLFAAYYRRHKPAFSTFFVNSTAHYQHKFWRNMHPDLFEIQPTAEEQRDYGDAILFGYQEMDRLIGRVLRLAPDATIAFMTGLGQQPYTRMESEGGKRFYRLKSEQVLRVELGLAGEFQYEPVMSDEFFIRFGNTAAAQAAATQLSAFRLPHGGEAFSAEVNGTDLIGQCRCRKIVDKTGLLTNENTGRTIKFHDVFYKVDSLKSGFHHPDGILWWRQAGVAADRLEASDKIPLTDIAPTILDYFGAAKPSHMRGSSFLRTESPAITPRPKRVTVPMS